MIGYTYDTGECSTTTGSTWVNVGARFFCKPDPEPVRKIWRPPPDAPKAIRARPCALRSPFLAWVGRALIHGQKGRFE